MFATDPTLYGATLPHRDFSFMNPHFAQWQNQQVPWSTFGQQVPWTPPYGNLVPPMFQSEFLPQAPPLFGNRLLPQMPYPPIPQVPYPPLAQMPYPPIPPIPYPPYAQLPFAPFAQGIQNLPQYKWQLPFAY